MNESTEPTESAEATQQFAIQKIYVKDASFESPGSPKSFSFKKWKPKIELNISSDQRHIEGELHEIILKITVTVSQEDKTAFLVEVQQAGLFNVIGFDEDQEKYLLGSQCLNILFPYAREAISDLSVRGGFPPLTLSPVSFDALYQRYLQQQREKQGETDATH